jgi:hypothetical protein
MPKVMELLKKYEPLGKRFEAPPLLQKLASEGKKFHT